MSDSERILLTTPPDIPGADSVVAWFGYWPTFHDAEVLSITLNRSGKSQVVLWAFENTFKVDPRGYYVVVKHAIITFFLQNFLLDEEGITNASLDFFNHQSVLSSAWVEQVEGGRLLRLVGIFGVSASFTCQHVSVKLEPGTLDGKLAQ